MWHFSLLSTFTFSSPCFSLHHASPPIYKPVFFNATLSRLPCSADCAERQGVCDLHHSLHLLFTFPPIFLHLHSTPIPLHFSFFCSPFALFLLISPLVSVSALIFCNCCHYVWVVHLFSQETQTLEYVYFCLCDYTYTTCCGKNVITNSESVAIHPCFISRAAQAETLLFGSKNVSPVPDRNINFFQFSLENPLQKHHFQQRLWMTTTVWLRFKKNCLGKLIMANLRLGMKVGQAPHFPQYCTVLVMLRRVLALNMGTKYKLWGAELQHVDRRKQTASYIYIHFFS